MGELDAFGVYPRTEGVPLSGVHYDRASSLVGGPEGTLRAGVGGVSIGRFGWAAPDGSVLNSRTSDQDRIGLVVAQGGCWQRIFWDEVSCTWRIREGLNLTLLSGAPGITARVDGVGAWGARVYADPVDGRLLPSYSAGLEATPWVIGPNAGADDLFYITTWNRPND